MNQIAIVGGGIVGLATARAIAQRFHPHLVVLEAEAELAAHQTGNNSGVIHSGLYYRPGSLKARNCVRGREAMIRFCEEEGIPYERCGKVVVAIDEAERERLEALKRRGIANGLQGIRCLDGEQLRAYEPHVAGVAGLLVPETGIVDFKAVAERFADQVREWGGQVRTRARVLRVERRAEALVLETTQGPVQARHLINCAGLQSDRVARLCGLRPTVQIVPFRGEYYELRPECHHLVKNLIYPVPDPRFPFLGVHFTRMIHGGVEAGPNAVLAFKREGYRWGDVSLRDLVAMAAYRGFWRMVGRYWRTGLSEMARSLSKRLFVDALQQLIPELRCEDVRRGGAGVRAQAVERDGRLSDDFRIIQAERMIHVLNAPSPAATASISIGETIAAMAADQFGLG